MVSTPSDALAHLRRDASAFLVGTPEEAVRRYSLFQIRARTYNNFASYIPATNAFDACAGFQKQSKAALDILGAGLTVAHERRGLLLA